MIRAFIAIDLSAEVRTALRTAQAQLQGAQLGVKVSWTKIENLHLTLQFLGDIDDAAVAGISTSLATMTGALPVFDVPVAGAGAFPDVHRPRVVWIGCDDSAGKLQALARAVQAAMRPCGFQPEPVPWTAHLTLGRIRTPRPDAALTRALDSLTNQAFGTLRVDAIHLFQSQLQPGGSIYTKLSSHPLKGD